MKQKLLFIFILSLAISATAFSQTADSTKSNKEKDLSFGILVGLGKWNYLNETYTDKREDRYTSPSGHSIKSLNIENILPFSPTLKFVLGYKIRNNISLVIGIKYFHNDIEIRNESTFYYDVPQSYYSKSFVKSTLGIKTNGIQLNLGPKLNYKHLNFSATLNINGLFSTKSYIQIGGYDSYFDVWDGYDKLKTRDVSIGGGVNIGYEKPMGANAFKLEFQCDYLVSDANILDKGTLRAINNSICIGFKF